MKLKIRKDKGMIGLNTQKMPSFGKLKVTYIDDKRKTVTEPYEVKGDKPISNCVRAILKVFKDDYRVKKLDDRGINVVVDANVQGGYANLPGTDGNCWKAKYEHTVYMETKDNKLIPPGIKKETNDFHEHELNDKLPSRAVYLLNPILSTMIEAVELIQDAKKN